MIFRSLGEKKYAKKMEGKKSLENYEDLIDYGLSCVLVPLPNNISQ